MFFVRNVMEDTGREHNVKGIVIERNFIALYDGEAFVARKTFSAQLDTA